MMYRMLITVFFLVYVFFKTIHISQKVRQKCEILKYTTYLVWHMCTWPNNCVQLKACVGQIIQCPLWRWRKLF